MADATPDVHCRHDMKADWCALCNKRGGDLGLSTVQWERNNPDLELDELAQRLVAEASPSQSQLLLVNLLVDRLSEHRRARVRHAEERASKTAARQRYQQSRRAEGQASGSGYSERPWTAPARSRQGQAWRKKSPAEQSEARAAQDQEFARFLRETDSKRGVTGSDFAVWSMTDAMKQFREHTRDELLIELTDELLASEFALGDGTSVTWGSATVAQHRQRYDLLLTQAGGSVLAAQRHLAAVQMLQGARANTLCDIQERHAA